MPASTAGISLAVLAEHASEQGTVMVKRLIHTLEGGTLLEIETARRRRHQYLLPAGMSPAARMAFLSSRRLEPVLARLEREDAEGSEGALIFALHKLVMDLMARYPLAEPASVAGPGGEMQAVPVARIVIRQCSPSVFVCCTSYLDETVCREEHLDTLQDVLAAALMALPPQAVAVEITYEGVVSGTYPRPVLERNPAQVASDALHTKGAIDEVSRQGMSVAPGARVPAGGEWHPR